MPSSKETEQDDLRLIDTSCWLFVGRVQNSVSTSELGDYFDQVGIVEKVLIDYGMGKIMNQEINDFLNRNSQI
jgi:RNA recognition motif-containing protein